MSKQKVAKSQNVSEYPNSSYCSPDNDLFFRARRFVLNRMLLDITYHHWRTASRPQKAPKAFALSFDGWMNRTTKVRTAFYCFPRELKGQEPI
jgi:hypothetical protein